MERSNDAPSDRLIAPSLTLVAATIADQPNGKSRSACRGASVARKLTARDGDKRYNADCLRI
jgi:hypothetical protein